MRRAIPKVAPNETILIPIRKKNCTSPEATGRNLSKATLKARTIVTTPGFGATDDQIAARPCDGGTRRQSYPISAEAEDLIQGRLGKDRVRRGLVLCTRFVHKWPLSAISTLFFVLKKSVFGADFSRSQICQDYDCYFTSQRGLPQGGEVTPLLAPLRGNVDLLGMVHVADDPGDTHPARA
jgi:hypothetical protein